MVELLVVIGVILVLLGLILPAIGKSMDQARTTADLVTLRSNTALVMQYAAQNQGQYPIASPWRCSAGRNWYEPLIAEGLLTGPAQADPRSYPKWEDVTFYLSDSLVADPVEFTWGSTRPCRESPTSPVFESDVPFPSAKGMMLRIHDPEHIPHTTGRAPSNQIRAFCCVDPWVAPVTFCDGSGVLGTHRDFAPDGVVNHNAMHQVGVPIKSPWNGYTARER